MAYFPKIVCLVAVLGGPASNPAIADDVADLYAARVLTTGQGEDNRPAALRHGFEDVLVKLSGDPALADDPAAHRLASNAAAYVEDFSYRDLMAGIPVHDEQGTRQRPYEMTIHFAPAKIDAALHELGRQPWRGPRPRLAIFVAVRNGALSYSLARDGVEGTDQKDALAAAAWRYGIPFALPNRQPDGDMIAADLPLAGTLIWDTGIFAWRAEWRFDAAGQSHRWTVSGVTFDEAFRSGIRGVAEILSGHGAPDNE